VVRRLWARFELLPFRYGMALGAGVVVLAGVLILAVTVSGGSGGASAPAGRPSQRPAEAAAPPAPTWGTYVPPRKAKATKVATVRPRTTSAAPRAKPAHASPRPSASCPPTLKKWTWVWEMCRRKQND
jgi:hypothetical protein